MNVSHLARVSVWTVERGCPLTLVVRRSPELEAAVAKADFDFNDENWEGSSGEVQHGMARSHWPTRAVRCSQ